MNEKEYEAENKIIDCEVDVANHDSIALINYRGNKKGIIKNFLAYNQVGVFKLPKGHGLKKGDRIVVVKKTIIEVK